MSLTGICRLSIRAANPHGVLQLPWCHFPTMPSSSRSLNAKQTWGTLPRFFLDETVIERFDEFCFYSSRISGFGELSRLHDKPEQM
jgi:hypothetical protein